MGFHYILNPPPMFSMKKIVGSALELSTKRLFTCWERADLLVVVIDVFCHFLKCVLVHINN